MSKKDQYIHGMDWTFQHKKGLSELANYRKYQFNLIKKNLGRNILEVGSGDKGFTAQMIQSGLPIDRLVSIEPSDDFYTHYQNNDTFPEYVKFTKEDLFSLTPETHGKFDTLVFIHVLEHIEKHREALDLSASLLESGGHVLIEVPAGPYLFSVHDDLLGHYRRYTKKILRSAINEKYYETERIWYNDPIGVLGSFVYFKLLRKKLNTQEGASLIKNQGSLYDKYVIPFEQSIEKYFTFPFGLSLTAILKRK